MLEQWLVELGAVLQQSIYDDGVYGYATFTPKDIEEASLRLRYDWENLHVGWGPNFDKWANSVDWSSPTPETKDELAAVLREVIRLGVAGKLEADFGDAGWCP
jgi:hypothetical protein